MGKVGRGESEEGEVRGDGRRPTLVGGVGAWEGVGTGVA